MCQPYHSILPYLVVHNYLIDAASVHQVEPDPKVEETILVDTGMFTYPILKYDIKNDN